MNDTVQAEGTTRRSTRLAKKEEKNDTVKENDTVQADAVGTRRSTLRSHANARLAKEEERKRNAMMNSKKRTSSTVPLRAAGNYEGAGSAGADAAKKTKESAAEKKKRVAKENAEAVLEKIQLEIHDKFVDLYKSAGMLNRGGNNLGRFEGDDEMVGPEQDGASDMMILTDSSRSKRQIAASESNVHYRPSHSDGLFANFNDTPENCRIFGIQVYKWLKENNIGIAKWRAERSHNMMTEVPLRALQLPHFITMGVDGELFEVAEVPENWNKKEKFHDVVAQLFGYKNIFNMSSHLYGEDCEMKGMDFERFIGNDVVSRYGPFKVPLDTYNRAGYRFKFKDGNKLRFDMSQFSAVASAAMGGDSDDS